MAQYVHPVKKSEEQATFEKAKILMMQIKALGTSQAGLSFELDVFVTPEGVDQDLGQNNRGGECPSDFGPRSGQWEARVDDS